MADKLKLKINTSKFPEFIDKLSIVASIDETVKVKIDSNTILMYSMLGSGNAILAFKSFTLKTSDYFDTSDMDYKIDLIIPYAKRFVKNLSFIKEMDKLVFEMVYRESDDSIYQVRGIQLTSGKFKVTWLGGEQNTIRDIPKEQLSQMMNVRNKKWSFGLSTEDFSDVKKLSNINGQKIIDMIINKGIVTWSQKSSWELEVDKIDDSMNQSLILNTRFLSCINDKVEKIEFLIFDNFMLVKDEDSDLMLSFEQDFSDQD